MPYNMQVMLLKAEEQEAFYRDKMYEKEREIEHLNSKVRALERKWEEAYEVQQELESALEEYDTNTHRWEDQLKSTNKSLQDLQRKCTNLEKQRDKLENKAEKLEHEKCKLSEKWIRLSAKNKNDDKIRNKLKEAESVNEKKESDINTLTEKLNRSERENNMLRKANDSLQTTVNQQMKKIKNLKSSSRANDDEKDIADQITNELMEKVNQYEEIVAHMEAENQELNLQLEHAAQLETQVQDYEQRIQELEHALENTESQHQQSLTSKLQEIKEECLIKQTENSRLREKNETLNSQIDQFKQEFESLQDYLTLKDDQIRNKFGDEEVCMCLQKLLKELVLVNKRKAWQILNIPPVDKADLETVLRSFYLTDPYVRFVIVNSVAYLQEWKESLNYLKQKYAESELKYENIIEKYQICKDQKTNLQNNSVFLETNIHRLANENSKLNEEKLFIMRNCMQNQSQINSQGPSFVQSYDAVNLQNAIQYDKENVSNYAFDDDESSVNINFTRAPLSSRQHHQSSVDQSHLFMNKLRDSHNFSNFQKNSSLISGRVSCDGILAKEVNSRCKRKGSLVSNKNYNSTSSMSFYKPHNGQNTSVNKSSVSIKPTKDVMKKGVKTKIENKRKQLIKSISGENIDELPTSNSRNSSRAQKHQRRNANIKSNTSMQKRETFGAQTSRY